LPSLSGQASRFVTDLVVSQPTGCRRLSGLPSPESTIPRLQPSLVTPCGCRGGESVVWVPVRVGFLVVFCVEGLFILLVRSNLPMDSDRKYRQHGYQDSDRDSKGFRGDDRSKA